jgi:hypothetical protein
MTTIQATIAESAVCRIAARWGRAEGREEKRGGVIKMVFRTEGRIHGFIAPAGLDLWMLEDLETFEERVFVRAESLGAACIALDSLSQPVPF